ncbi:3-dehydroquinate dehydratase AroQ, type-II 3-dehydroquinase family [Burkholderia plantarii]|uniref:3-dehydroquinate dehydratase n=1 Tax=Burkholderia plantarii TaxID=41899 RepID=A0A0B6SCN6_BURPL|nr:3-dehydroquinate dehydratase AroQ, type-II 3-dehydroquinase family [Burkholderia plantarii]
MLQGINHNMLGKRDPARYGTVTLADIDARVQAQGEQRGVRVESFRTNSEAAMCERIHHACEAGKDAVLINAGAWTHYSYRIRDALAILTCPVVELHMSNLMRGSRSGTARCSPGAVTLAEYVHKERQRDLPVSCGRRIAGGPGQVMPRREAYGKVFAIKRSTQQMPLQGEVLADQPEALEESLSARRVANPRMRRSRSRVG